MNYFEIIFRCIAVYFVIMIALKFLGKKELSQLNLSDVILILLIANSVQNAMIGSNTSLLGGLVAAISLFAINYALKVIMYENKSFYELVQGKPQILIHNGKLDFSMLSKLNISSDELNEAIRERGVEYFENVKLAMFEPDGNISVIAKSNDTQSNADEVVNEKRVI